MGIKAKEKDKTDITKEKELKWVGRRQKGERGRRHDFKSNY
jgi:hypothetical protein